MSATLTTPKTTSGGEIIRELVNASDGAGLHFDGAAGNIDIASPPDLGTKFSFEFVVKADSWSSSAARHLVDFGNGGRFAFAGQSTTLQIYDSQWRDFGVAVLDDLKVHHLVVTVDGTAATLYDNGNQVGTATLGSSSDVDSCSDAAIGSYYNNSTLTNFNGTIYRCRFWNKALSSTEVQTAFERADVDFSSQYGSQTELVTNGDFASATGWSKGDVTVAGDGTAVWAASGNYQYLRRSDWSITKGKKYRITVVTSAHTTNGTLNVMGYTGSPSIATTNLDGDAFTISGTGTHIFEFEALADSSGGVLFGSYPTGAAYVGTMTDISCVQIGAVSDYDLAYAQPALSTLIQDRSNAADGVASSNGVKQVQPITQLNSTSARIGSTQLAAGTSPYIPADGELLASGNIGSGSADPNINGWGNAITIDNSDAAALEFAKSGTLYGFVGVQGAPSSHALDIAAYQSQDMRFRVGSNAGTTAITIDSTGAATFTSNATSDQFLVTNADATSTSAPDLVLYRNSAAPADSDNLGLIQFRGKNSTDQTVNYGSILGTVTDISDASEDSKLTFYTYKAGTETPTLTLESGIGNFNQGLTIAGENNWAHISGTDATSLSLADESQVQLADTEAGAMMIHIYDRGSGAGAVIFATYFGQPELVAGSSTYFDVADTDGKYCVIKSSSSHDVYFKNRSGTTRNFRILVTAGVLDNFR